METNGNTKTNGVKNVSGETFKNVTVIQSRAVQYLLMKLRNKKTQGKEFMVYGDRLMRLLAEEALARLPSIVEGTVETPCGTATGPIDSPTSATEDKLCLVSVVRSGDILQEAVRQLHPGMAIGKILIQRDESTPDKRPVLFYKKLPKDISQRFVMLVDPMLATAGSAKKAISVLIESGVSPSNIQFLNLICAPEGLKALHDEYPEVTIITGAVDEKLNSDCFIVPGLGDYGDRYYQTE